MNRPVSSLCQGLLVMLLALFSCAAARADSVIFASDGAGVLWRVDSSTGAATPVGSMGLVMTDIAFSPSGVLFGVTFNSLYQINPQTGAATLLGSLGVGSANGLAFGPGGVLFLSTSSGPAGGELRTVNPLSGATTLVGSLGFASEGDLVFSSQGTLFLSARNSQLVVVDPLTGAGQAVGAIGFPDVYGLAWLNGQLYALNLSGQLLHINTSTGAGALLANTSPRVTAWGASSSPVPEPASLLLFATGAALAASLHRRWLRRFS